MNKSIAEAVGSTMQTGLANYISTGRPMANDHYGWRSLSEMASELRFRGHSFTSEETATSSTEPLP